MRSTLSLVVGLMVCTFAHAQIYKCQEQGKTVYSDKPCPNAKPVDITNGKAPPLEDQLAAQLRYLNTKREMARAELQAQKEHLEHIECEKIIRDHNWTIKTADKYQDDAWWQNRVADSSDAMRKRCGKYLIPGGAR